MSYMVPARPAPSRAHQFPIYAHDTRNLNVGLMGGSFNPPHEGHLFVAKTALKALNLNEIWWLVSPQNPLKSSKGMAPFNIRFQKTIEIAKHPKFRVLSLESSFKTKTTSSFLKKLIPRCPCINFIWLMGSDNLSQFHRWHKCEVISKSLPVAVFSRPGFLHRSLSSSGSYVLRKKVNDIQLRELVYKTPPAWGYIDHGRYKISGTEIRKLNDVNNEKK